MDQLVWNAARRVALLVVCGLVVIGALLVHDTLTGRRAVVVDISGVAAAALATAALVALVRAKGFFERPEDVTPSLPTAPYRHNPFSTAGDSLGADRVR